MWIIIAAIINFYYFCRQQTPSLQLTKKETPTQILVYTAPSTEQDLTAQS